MAELSAWLLYRTDSFLEREPILQIPALFAAAVAMICTWAALVAHLAPRAPGGSEAIWWALTRFLDGGTMAGDPAALRALATLATLSGVVGVAFLTSVLTSKMGERIGVLASGTSAVAERDHVLVLGFDGRVKTIATELGRSGRRVTLVVLAPAPRKQVEASIGAPSGVSVVVRTGDPQDEGALRKVRAHRARTVIVLAPRGSPEDAVRWSFVTLLAIRRVVDAAAEVARPRLVVEARDDEAEQRLRRALAPAPAAGSAPAGAPVLEADFVVPTEAIGGMLAMSLRQPGLFPVLRAFLSADGVHLELLPVTRGQVGATWEEVAASASGGALLGLAHHGSPPVVELNPGRAGSLRVAASDTLIALRDARSRVRFTATADAPPLVLAPLPGAKAGPRRVLVLGANSALPALLDHLPLVLGSGDLVRLVTGRESTPGLAGARDRLAAAGIQLEVDSNSPLHVAAGTCDEADQVTVVLAPDESRDKSCDAMAVELLVTLRGRGGAGRAVTDVHNAVTAGYLAGEGNDFLVSSQLIAMMLAQAAASHDTAEVVRQLLSARAAQQLLTLPVEWFGFPPGAQYSDACARLRASGAIALGYQLPSPGGVQLAPPADATAWTAQGSRLVALAPVALARPATPQS